MNWISHFLFLSCSLTVSRCTSEVTTIPSSVSVPEVETTDSTSVSSGNTNEADSSSYEESMNWYGFLTLDHLQKQNVTGNILLSSISNLLSQSVDSSQKFLAEYKKTENVPNDRNVTLGIGNLVMYNMASKPDKEAMEESRNNMTDLIEEKSFDNETRIMEKLNQWASQKTFNRINEIPRILKVRGASMIKVNTLYFKGQWKESFTKNLTQEGLFTNGDGTKSKVKMMSVRNRKFNYVYSPDHKLQIIEIPYKGNFSLMLMMPMETDSLSNLVSTAQLNETSKLNELLNSMKPTKMGIVSIPKFKLEDTRLLSLEGFQFLFFEQYQKTLFEIDEEGTSDATGTPHFTSTARSLSTAEKFIVNRPFLFMVRDKTLSLDLLLGRVTKLENN